MRPLRPSLLYLQIRDELARQIAQGDLPTGSVLPNEFMLSNDMQVSLGTIRKAVEMLVGEGLLERKQGRGTTVAGHQSSKFRGKFDRIRSTDGSLVAWRLGKSQVEVRAANAGEISALRMKEGDEVIVISRTREADGKPAEWEVSRLPKKIFGDVIGLDDRDLTIESLAFFCGFQILGWDERVALTFAPTSVAEALGVSLGAPLLRLERLILDRDGRPLEWRLAYCEMTGRIYQASSVDEVESQSAANAGIFDRDCA